MRSADRRRAASGRRGSRAAGRRSCRLQARQLAHVPHEQRARQRQQRETRRRRRAPRWRRTPRPAARPARSRSAAAPASPSSRRRTRARARAAARARPAPSPTRSRTAPARPRQDEERRARATGSPSANDERTTPATAARAACPSRIGCRGRQRKPISAPSDRARAHRRRQRCRRRAARVVVLLGDTVGPSVMHGAEATISSAIENATMITHIQLRDAHRGPALAQLGQHGRPLDHLAALARPHAAAGTRPRRGTSPRRGERPAGARPEHERGRQRRAGELGRPSRSCRRRRLGLLDLVLGHGLRHQPGVGRAEERLGRAEQRLDHDDLPDLDGAGEDQHRQQRVQREAHEVGDDHHPVARQPVGPHAADQQEADERQRVRREHDADVGRRADLGDVQRERDEHDAVADRARRLAEQTVGSRGGAEHVPARHAIMAAMDVDELFDAWERAWSGRDPARVRILCAPDVRLRGPADARAAARRPLARRPRAQLWNAFPDARVNAHGRAPQRRPLRLRAVQAPRHAHGPLGGHRADRRASSSCTRSSTPSSRTAGCCASARSSTSTAPRPRSACSPKPGTVGEKALLLLRGFGLRS